MARWNALPPRNAARCPPTSETLPIVLLRDASSTCGLGCGCGRR